MGTGIKSLLVIWRDKISTLYFHVGTLTYDGHVYRFEYTHHCKANRKVHDAIDHGYRLHPAFVELEKKYESKSLFPAFDRRVPSDDRVDYAEILKDLNLPPNANRMDLLRETRGIISSDPHFFEEPLVLDENNRLSNHFYVNGMRHRDDLPKDWDSLVRKGDRLKLEPEKNNIYDPYAIKLKTEDGLWLGYIPGVHAQAITALIERDIKVILTVDETRPAYAPQWWVRVSLEASLGKIRDNSLEKDELEGLVFRAA